MASVASPGGTGSSGCRLRSSSMSRNGIGSFVLVDWMFLRIWSRWPLAVAGTLGAYFLKVAEVRDGQSRIHLLSSAVCRVDGTGENRVA